METFRLPRDPAERNIWIVIIRTDNIPNKKDTVVWERHWPGDYEIFVIMENCHFVTQPQCLFVWNPVWFQLCYQLQELTEKDTSIRENEQNVFIKQWTRKTYCINMEFLMGWTSDSSWNTNTVHERKSFW